MMKPVTANINYSCLSIPSINPTNRSDSTQLPSAVSVKTSFKNACRSIRR